MKLTICILAVLFLACASARPQSPDDVEILTNEFDNIGIDGYKFAYVLKQDKTCCEFSMKTKIKILVLLVIHRVTVSRGKRKLS